jgi:regulator of telomere elongation helicase 1
MNTVYKPRTVLIASRDHLCVNAAVNMNKGFALNAACRSIQKAINPCLYFKNRDSSQKKLSWDPLDIEELHTLAKKDCFCPYFAMKDRAAGADVIFMPYNYLIDEKIRENFEINFENSIIIFDEAHNITSSCEDISSFSIDCSNLEKVVIELTELQESKRIDQEKKYDSKEEDV